MAPIFDREEALASPYPPLAPIGALALEFAVLGHIDLARDLVGILFREYPLDVPSLGIRELNLAWNTTGKWPDSYPAVNQSKEVQAESARELEDELWPQELDEEECTEDETGLGKVLELADAVEAEGDDEDEDAEVEYIKSNCLAKAFSISLKLAEDKAGKAPLDELDQRSRDILRQIAERMHCRNQTEALASVLRAWPYLAKGLLAEAVGAKSDKLDSLGKTIKETIAEWFSRGPLSWTLSEKSIKELLDVCSNKSKEFWAEEYDEPAPETLFAPSGASKEEIAELEKKRGVTLPADYKEFLELSNGFQQIIADGIFEEFEAPLFPTSEISWRKTDDLLKVGVDDGGFAMEEDDDLDDDDDEAPALEISRPVKKIKLAGGEESVTKEATEDEIDDEDAEGELEAMAWLKEQFNNFKLELFPIPPVAQLSIAEEAGEEWPEIEKIVEVGSSEGSYLWLLPPDQAKKAKDVYLKVLDSTKNEHVKRAIRWAAIAFAGSEQAFRDFDGWVFIGWSGGEMHAWSSFKRYLQELADTCTKLERVEDAEKVAKNETLAYSCR